LALAYNTLYSISRHFALIGQGCLLVFNGFAQKGDHVSTTSYLGTDPVSGGLVQYQITTNDLSGSTHFFLTNGGALYKVPLAEQQATSVAYLRSINSQVAFTGSSVEFVAKDLKSSPFGSHHYSFAQSLNGIPIYGSDIVLHYAPNGQLRGLNGAGCKLKANAKTAETQQGEGIAAATGHVNRLTRAHYLNAIQRKLLEYDGPSAQLVYYSYDGDLHLCWQVRYCPNFSETWEVLVSASSLQVLKCVELSCYIDGARTSRNSTGLDGRQYEIGTYKIGDAFYMVDAGKPMFKASESLMPHNPKGAILTYQADGLTRDELDKAFIPQQGTNTFGTTTAEKAAVSAHAHASTYFDKLAQAPFSYSSYDNQGSNITMYVGLQDPIKPFIGWENASWNGRVAFFWYCKKLF
jgi:Zn-dependent metalloprotease